MDSDATNPGPIDGSILYDQDKHVSSAVWEGQERGALRCHEHTSKLDEWRLTAKQIELIEKAGFGYLRLIPAISLDNPLISALVERWRRETNTFHFNFGEMTITLEEVALSLGLAIDGKPVIGTTYTSCGSVCQKFLGKAPDSGYTTGGMVKLSWLKEFFSRCPEDALLEETERHTRAYLLYLVGSTIFSTTTGNKVPVMYLPLFENFDEAGKYAWGAAALGFLYRALGKACLKSQSTISGCLTLLQCWSYYHLDIGRPKLKQDPNHDRFPFVLKWKGKQSGPTTKRDVVFYRKALDSLTPSDVEWLPYKDMVIPEHIENMLILGRSKTMLICFDKAERHLPDRCLRQFGMLQSIPNDVRPWERKSRGVEDGLDLSGKMELELKEWSDRLLHIMEGDDDIDENEYFEWYLKITRKIVGRPISLSSEFQRTHGGLREIAHIADTFSTKGLDSEQIESIIRIRSIVHECLRGRAKGPVTPQIELGKRARGKEKVRRKNAGKRVRKDDTIEYQAASEDDQSQFFGVPIEVDPLQTLEDSEADDTQLYHAVVEDDDAQLCHAPDKVDDAQLYDGSNDVDNAQLCDGINEVDNTQLCDEINEVDESQLYDATKDVNESQLYDATKDVNESQVYDATKDVDETQLYDVTKDVNESQVYDATKDVDETQLYDVTKDVNDSQLCDGANDVDDSQISLVAGESHSQTTKVAEEIIPQQSLETTADVAQQSDYSVVV